MSTVPAAAATLKTDRDWLARQSRAFRNLQTDAAREVANLIDGLVDEMDTIAADSIERLYDRRAVMMGAPAELLAVA